MSGELEKGQYIGLRETLDTIKRDVTKLGEARQDFVDRAKAEASLEEFKVKGGVTLDELKKELEDIPTATDVRLGREDVFVRTLKLVIETYRRENPLRTADMHRDDCRCLRCAIDAAEYTVECFELLMQLETDKIKVLQDIARQHLATKEAGK